MGAREREEIVEDGFFTIKEATDFCRLSRSELYSRMNRGELSYAQMGRRRMIPRKALVALTAKNLVTHADD